MLDVSELNFKILNEIELLSGKCHEIKNLNIIMNRNDFSGDLFVKNIDKIISNTNVPIKIKKNIINENSDIKSVINSLNEDDSCCGILVMRNESEMSSMKKYIEAKNLILPRKDIEGTEFSDNLNRIYCTAKSCWEIINFYSKIEGKDVVIVGYGKVVGKPLAYLLMRRHAGSVTTLHKYTVNPDRFLSKADIVVSAVGKPHFLKFKAKSEEVIIVDAGISKHTDNNWVGDVSPCMHDCKVTSVPGGVGPITTMLIVKNTLLSSLGKY